MVPRPHLIDRLDRAAARKVTLIAGPAGSGKTTLLSEWAAAVREHRHVAWVSIDETDDDVVLWTHVIESLRLTLPELTIGADAGATGPSPLTSLVLPRLLNDLAEGPPVHVVLDDFHRLDRAPSRDSVAWVIDHAPPTLHLVIASRTEPRLPLASLRAHGDLAEIRLDELRFDYAEGKALLNDQLRLDLVDRDAELLVDRTEGWPAGLYLAGLSLARASDRHAYVASFDASNRHVLDFLVEEVLDGHDPVTRDLMVRSSILTELTGPMVDWVLDSGGSAELLRALADSNMFLVPIGDRTTATDSITSSPSCCARS